jgi:hypothetical protein
MIATSFGVFLILVGAMLLYNTWRYYRVALVPRMKPRVDPAFFSAMGFESGDSLLAPSPTLRQTEAFQTALDDSTTTETEPVAPIGFKGEDPMDEESPPPILDVGEKEEPSLYPRRVEEDSEPHQQNLGF